MNTIDYDGRKSFLLKKLNNQKVNGLMRRQGAATELKGATLPNLCVVKKMSP